MKRWRASSRVVHSRVPDGAVLVHLDTKQITKLNASASLLWATLAGGATADELARALCDEFDVDEARARADVRAVLRELEQAGVVLTSS